MIRFLILVYYESVIYGVVWITLRNWTVGVSPLYILGFIGHSPLGPTSTLVVHKSCVKVLYYFIICSPFTRWLYFCKIFHSQCTLKIEILYIVKCVTVMHTKVNLVMDVILLDCILYTKAVTNIEIPENKTTMKLKKRVSECKIA